MVVMSMPMAAPVIVAVTMVVVVVIVVGVRHRAPMSLEPAAGSMRRAADQGLGAPGDLREAG